MHNKNYSSATAVKIMKNNTTNKRYEMLFTDEIFTLLCANKRKQYTVQEIALLTDLDEAHVADSIAELTFARQLRKIVITDKCDNVTCISYRAK